MKANSQRQKLLILKYSMEKQDVPYKIIDILTDLKTTAYQDYHRTKTYYSKYKCFFPYSESHR